MKITFILLTVFAIVLAATHGGRKVRVSPKMEQLFLSQDNVIKNQWSYVARAEPQHTHSFVIVPNQVEGAADQCDSLINEIANPTSPKYGKHMTLSEVNNMFISRENVHRITKWLKNKGLSFILTSGFITVTAPISQVETIFSAQFHEFTAASGKKIKRTAEYSLPAEIQAHVDFVSGMVDFPPAGKPKTAGKPINKRQGGYVYPSTLNSVYNIKDNQVASDKSTQSLFEALGQQFSPGDLADFQYYNNITDQPISQVIGSNSGWWCFLEPNNCGEANLDVQFMMGVAQGSPTTFWVIDPNSQDPFLDWVIALAATKNPPLIHSISYGSIVSEEPLANIIRYNTEMCKFGLRGLTVFVASGDDGVANFEARGDASQCGFNPSFPATSPYVVAVGATQGPESGSAEIACSSDTGGIITTGGGFSVNFARPAYQADVVNKYLKNGPNMPPLNLFNSTNRGYPDVALLGLNYEVYIDRFATAVSGTSASTPAFAGMITLVNGLRIKAGKSPVGFLNPALYKIAATQPGVFRDIKSGKNNCCASGGPCCQYGFTASAGWDPLTGLGSVDFEALKNALVKY